MYRPPKIRRAVLEDARGIAEIHARAWQRAYRGAMPDSYLDHINLDEWTKRRQKNLVRHGTDTFVVETSGCTVGFCVVTKSRDDYSSAGTGELSAIYVDPESWRCGIGRALLDAALVQARQRNFDELMLWVLDSNYGAQSFYERFGFTRDGGRKTDERIGFAIHEVRYRKPL